MKVFTRKENSDLPAGVDKMVRVSVAQLRKLTQAIKWQDVMEIKVSFQKLSLWKTCRSWKMATVDIILNPLGVPDV